MLDKLVPYAYPSYTNPYSFQERTAPLMCRREKLWNGEEAILAHQWGEGNIQSFIKEGMHFYRLKWKFRQPTQCIMLGEKEDKEYIDLCMTKSWRSHSILLAKRNQQQLNSTQGDLLQIFIKKKVIGLDPDTLRKKLRIVPANSKILQPLREILRIHPSGKREAIKLESKFLEFTYEYLEFLQTPLEDAPTFLTDYRIRQIKEVHQYLEQHYLEGPELKNLAKKAGINKDHLNLGFQTLFQSTVRQFIIQKRLEKARQLLFNTDLPLKDIASQVGYANYGHFTRLYQKQFGLPPGQESRD